jgi:hypothetical protein
MSVIPATWEMEMGRSLFETNPGKNVNKTPSQQNKPDVVGYAYHSSYREPEMRGLKSETGPRQRPYLKDN